MSVKIVRILCFIALLGVLPFPAQAQNITTVSATIVDPHAVPYSFATISAQLVPTGITPTIGGQAVSAFTRATADVTGTFTMNLASNAVLSPGGTQWQFTVNETPGILPPFGTGPQSFQATISISGASQSITSTLNALAPALTLPFSGTGGSGTVIGSAGQSAYLSALNTVSGGTIVLDMAGISGADLGAKMNNCIAALPASGGTCKGDNLTGAQTLSSAVSTAKSVMFTFSGQAISQSAAITLSGSGAGINSCGGALPVFTKAGNIDQITTSGSNDYVSCISLVGVGGSFTGNGIVLNGASASAYDNVVSGEAGIGIKSTSLTALIQGNNISNGTTGSGAAASGNGFWAFNNITGQTADGLDLGNQATAYSNSIGVSITAAISGLCGINMNIDQIGDRSTDNQITINDTHNGDLNYGECVTPPASGHTLNMLVSGDNFTGILSGGAQADGFFLNNANGLNNNWLLTVENVGCIHLNFCIKRVDPQNQKSYYTNIEPGDTVMDAGTGSNNDVWVWDNLGVTFANLPSPAGPGSHGYCTNCSTGRTITSAAGTGNYIHRVQNGAVLSWVGEPIFSYSNIQFAQGTAAASSKAQAFAGNTIGGDIIVVGVSCSQAASPTITVTDTQNNVYTAGHAIQSDLVPARWVQIFYAPAIVGGPDTVTASSSVNLCTSTTTSISEYQQVVQVSPVDGAGISTNGNTVNPTSGTFTVTVGSLVVGFWCVTGGGTGFAGAGFTLRGSDGTCSLEDTLATSTSSQILAAGNAGNWALMGVAFKAQP
jgi:hypothetical protein